MKKVILFISIILFFASCSNNESDIDDLEFAPGEISVGFKSGTDVNEIFNFINQFNHQVDKINSLTFISNLPAEKLEYILDELNEKNYTNDGVNLFTNGYLHAQTNEITIFPKLFEMNNKAYQNDWLESMNEFELLEKHDENLASGTILFYVPVGKEKEWRNIFLTYDIVKWAQLNYIADIEL